MPGFIIDLDGTMYAGERPIPKAKQFIETLQRRGWPFLFVTNNSSRTPDSIAKHLEEVVEIEVVSGDIMTSSQAAARYIVDQHRGKRFWHVGETGLVQALTTAGLKWTDQDPDYVVQGIDRQFTYAKLKTAVNFLLYGATYILTNPDHLLPAAIGFHPGAGSIAGAIQAASQVQPIIVGKPSAIIMNYAVELLGLPAAEIWVIGDNLRTDIGGGAAVGCRTALVLTGLATANNVQRQIADAGIQADLICGDLLDLISKLSL